MNPAADRPPALGARTSWPVQVVCLRPERRCQPLGLGPAESFYGFFLEFPCPSLPGVVGVTGVSCPTARAGALHRVLCELSHSECVAARWPGCPPFSSFKAPLAKDRPPAEQAPDHLYAYRPGHARWSTLYGSSNHRRPSNVETGAAYPFHQYSSVTVTGVGQTHIRPRHPGG